MPELQVHRPAVKMILAGLQAIFAHQHPPNCSEVKFLIHTSHGSGIGSQIHMYGAALAMAMALDRVYVEVYNDAVLYTTGGGFCKEGQRMDECFFQSFSGCTLADAGECTTVVLFLQDTSVLAVRNCSEAPK